MLQRYLRRLGWLGVLAAVLVTAGVILAATKDYLPSSVLVMVAVVVAGVGPKVIEWVKAQRTEDQEEANLLRIRRLIGEELIGRFKTAIEAHRYGFALVVSVLYWRLAGMRRPVAEAELRELYTLCLERFYPLLKANDKDYQVGVAWACEPLESRAALLVRTTGGGVEGFKIFDYVRDWSEGVGGDVDQRLRAVPEPIWRYVVDRAVPREAGAVGAEAYTQRKLDTARDAWTKVVASGDPESVPLAALVGLGTLFSEQGENTRAEQAYQQAIDSGDPKRSSAAALSLGMLLEGQGENARTEQAFQQAIDSGHPKFARQGTLGLQRLHSSSSQ